MCDQKEYLKQELMDYINFPKISLPAKRGENYYFTYNKGLEDQSKTYKIDAPGVFKIDPNDPLKGASLFFDPTTLSKDGNAMVGDSAWSKDWKSLALLVQTSGSDWGSIKIMDTASKKLLKDELLWCKHSFMSWTRDSKGFFYARYDAPKHGDVTKAGKETDKLTNQKIFYHLVGTE